MILLSIEFFQKIMLFGIAAVVLIILFFAIKTLLQARKIIKENGIVHEPKQTKHTKVFGLMLAVSALVVYLIKLGLENNVGMLNEILFTVFPYLAIAIFLVGSIYRYRAKGFKVSSLSSEFLERKKLFWGSQPFHWGLLILFFGHLTAFLFPSAILAWNGEPVRLLILEITGFIFGLSALLGLILLIKRRLNNSQLLVVSNKMDMLVYTTLFVQILSGLGIAYFERWGSSWFASVLSPYLKSLCALQPDITAVSAMPWIVQIHIFSALFIIAVIPFTRFMHFLVAPIDYTWRGYQLVIWNYGRKSIRNSRAHFFGRKPKV